MLHWRARLSIVPSSPRSTTAKAGLAGAFHLPLRGRVNFPATPGDKFCPAGQREFRTSCERISFCFAKTVKPRNLFGFGASFTLAAIYSRGTCRPTTIDVLMFHFRVRNGTGWDHQAMTTRLLPYFVLRTLYFVLQLVWLSSALAGSVYLRLGGRLASAWLVLYVCCSPLTPITFVSSRNCLSPGWCIRSIGC